MACRMQFRLSLMKQLPITERAALQFRAEFFNVFNIQNYGLPNTTFGGAGLGLLRISLRVQLSGRFSSAFGLVFKVFQACGSLRVGSGVYGLETCFQERPVEPQIPRLRLMTRRGVAFPSHSGCWWSELQIPPLRFASVGMTRRGRWSIKGGGRTDTFFINYRGPLGPSTLRRKTFPRGACRTADPSASLGMTRRGQRLRECVCRTDNFFHQLRPTNTRDDKGKVNGSIKNGCAPTG